MPWELIITLALIVAEAVALYVVMGVLRRPPDPTKPRLIPYNLVAVILMVLLLATLAHLVSMITGEQLQPRRRRGM